jgi:hypothetical protein
LILAQATVDFEIGGQFDLQQDHPGTLRNETEKAKQVIRQFARRFQYVTAFKQ